MQKKIYLAGPEVFLPDSKEIGRQKQALCAHYGFIGLYPGDGDGDSIITPSLIYAANVERIRECDVMIANLTAFRGPSADLGTVWELGFAVAVGKPGYGYSNSAGSLLDRTRAFDANSHYDPRRACWADGSGLAIEDFGAAENLMITESIIRSGAQFVTATTSPDDLYRNLDSFEACLRLLVA